MNRKKEISLDAQKLLSKNPIFLDTETTGIDPDDVIVQIGIVDQHGNVIFESLINPERHIPIAATRIHGIADSDVKRSPTWMEVSPFIKTILFNQIIGIYNAEFDLRLLRQTNSVSKIGWIIQKNHTFCVMKMFAAWFGEWNERYEDYKYQKLEFAGKYFSIPSPNSHSAVSDARLAAAVLQKMAQSKFDIRNLFAIFN